MKRVFIVHRWSGSPASDWIPWLENELAQAGVNVFVPAMSEDVDEDPVIEDWVQRLSENVGVMDGETYFVAHSIGCQAVMRYLESSPTPAAGAIFVAGWFKLKNLEDAETEAAAKPWMENPLDFKKIKHNIGKLIVMLSDNDPYDAVIENAEAFRDKLGAEIHILDKMGHFSADDGFKEFPLLKNAILDLLNKG